MAEPPFPSPSWPWWNIIALVLGSFSTIAALLGWQVLRMPQINFGIPQDRAGENQLSWWQIPLSILRTRWYDRDRLTDCRIFVRVGQDNMQIYQGVFPTINGPVETINLIYGGPQEFAPIVARSTEPYSVSGDPRFRPFIPLLPGVATMTDLSAVINGTGIKIFQSERLRTLPVY
jgi:hypothetical protein